MPIAIQNPTRIPKDFVIFYCWQDHLAKKHHRYLIRDALNNAISRVQAELPDELDCAIRLDSDIIGRAGAVDIAETILSKINDSTMIVGDITPVLRDGDTGRFYPNPNVMFEVGYGAMALGWTRVVCVFNAARTDEAKKLKAEDLPFDIRHRRLNSYVCSADSGVAQATKELEAELVASIRAVIQEIDRGEFDPTLGDAAVKRARDIELLRQLLSTIHRTTMGRIIERGTELNVHYDGLLFWDGFTAVVNSAHFRFYDKNVERLARALHDVWETATQLRSSVLFPHDSGTGYSLLPEHQWSKDYRERVKAMGGAYASMPSALKAFLDYIHEHYPEIDFNVTDCAAWKSNLPYLTTTLMAQKTEKATAAKSATKQSAVRSRKRPLKTKSISKKKSVAAAAKNVPTNVAKKAKSK